MLQMPQLVIILSTPTLDCWMGHLWITALCRIIIIVQNILCTGSLTHKIHRNKNELADQVNKE